MRVVIADPEKGKDRKFDKYFEKYVQKRGYKCSVDDLPMDIKVELYAFAIMSYCALDINIDEEFKIILKTEETPENPIEFVAIKKSKYSLNFDAEHFKKVLEIDENDPTFDMMASPLNWRRLEDNESFKHPLWETKEAVIRGEKECLLNSYAVASFLIDTIRNPSDTSDGGKKAESKFLKFVMLANPQLPAQSLLEKVKAGYVREMMQFCTLVNTVFEQCKDNPDIGKYF